MITHAPVLGGSTDYSCLIRVIDSTDGTPETGFDHATSGIDLWYRRGARGAITSITEAALAAVDSAHSDGGVEQVGNGYVRVDLPDAAVAAGVECVQVGGTATGMVVIGALIPIVNTTTAMLGVNVVSFTANAITATAINADAITAAKVAADVHAEAADAVWDEAQGDHVGAGTFGLIASEIADILTDTGTTLQAELDGIQADTEDLQTKIGTPAGASVSADIAAVKAETAAIVNDTDVIDDATSGLVKIASDVAAILVDTGTTLQGELDGIQADTEDIQARLPAALTAAGNIKADVLRINGTALTGDGSGTPWGPA